APHSALQPHPPPRARAAEGRAPRRAAGQGLAPRPAPAEPAEAADAVAHVRADVEGKITPLHEAAVEEIHGPLLRPVPIVHVERTAEGRKGGIGAQASDDGAAVPHGGVMGPRGPTGRAEGMARRASPRPL